MGWAVHFAAVIGTGFAFGISTLCNSSVLFSTVLLSKKLGIFIGRCVVMQSSGGSTSILKVPHRPRSRKLIVIAERRVIYISSTFPSLQWLYKKVAWHRRGTKVFLRSGAWSSESPLIMVVIFISLLLAGWVLWKIFRWVVIGSPLDNIPGPPSDFFGRGDHFCSLHSWLGSSHGYKAQGSLVTLAWTSTKNCWQNVREITQSSPVPMSR